MDLNMQSKLLRVLQEEEVTRIGGNNTIKLDVRVIVATHRNLIEEVKKVISEKTFIIVSWDYQYGCHLCVNAITMCLFLPNIL
jgi:hypothetical protein